MSIDHRRRSLALLACLGPLGLSPIARASVHLAPVPAPLPDEGPADLIRRVFDEVLTSPRRRAAMTRMQGR